MDELASVIHTTRSPEETALLAERFVSALALQERDRGTSTLVALSGDLGAGKTTFTQGVARALGVVERVTSPTFVIERVYRLPESAAWKHLVHIDAYRLSGDAELATIGWYDIATNPQNLVLMEWPEQVERGVPSRAVRVSFEEVDEHTRNISIHGVGL
ncbi:MAG: tRNA (adenosine(37)-N6)-threonylcarbamoyltransferase complex ATPase subunit type 1 TsaE [Candidatus Pacebacteria bacterium]|nr:tRNA (adenosine(37)-N6)-threonylcarbamoyltransferase complex ATPase subunit type 1 TsaE [Candidatus Paceibacterota bacterium]